MRTINKKYICVVIRNTKLVDNLFRATVNLNMNQMLTFIHYCNYFSNMMSNN